MPKDFLALDTGFPSFTGRETVGQKVDQLYNYTYMLLENLRYCLRNLGPENFNEAALNEITEPIYADIQDAEGHTAQLALTAQALAARIGDAEGHVSQLQQTRRGPDRPTDRRQREYQHAPADGGEPYQSGAERGGERQCSPAESRQPDGGGGVRQREYQQPPADGDEPHQPDPKRGGAGLRGPADY